MDLGTTLSGFKQCVEQIPEKDNRAKLGPREFVVSLIFCLHGMDRGQRTIDAYS